MDISALGGVTVFCERGTLCQSFLVSPLGVPTIQTFGFDCRLLHLSLDCGHG